MSKEKIVVGIGGAGMNIVYFLSERLCNTRFLTMNSYSACMKESARNIHHLPVPETSENQNTDIENVINHIAEEFSSSLVGRGSRHLYLISGLGGVMGTQGVKSLARVLARRRALIVHAILIWPFEFESRKRHEFAKEAISELVLTTDSLTVLRNELPLKEGYGGLGLEEYFQVISSKVGAMITI